MPNENCFLGPFCGHSKQRIIENWGFVMAMQNSSKLKVNLI